MGEAKENDVYEEELLDYEEDDDKTVDGSAAKPTGEVAKKGYVGIHSSGFRDFLLKPELLRAIQDCGFEHPSEDIVTVSSEQPVGVDQEQVFEEEEPKCLSKEEENTAEEYFSDYEEF